MSKGLAEMIRPPGVTHLGVGVAIGVTVEILADRLFPVNVVEVAYLALQRRRQVGICFRLTSRLHAHRFVLPRCASSEIVMPFHRPLDLWQAWLP